MGALQCWMRGLDGIVFQRHHVERLVGLERFRGTRVEWLKDDLREFFPHLKTLVYKNDSFASIFASRRKFDRIWVDGPMGDDARIKKMPRVKFGVFQLWERPHAWKTEVLKQGFAGIVPLFNISSNYDERLAASFLSLLGDGRISPNELMQALNPQEPARNAR
jgi:hypothetical protein